MRARFAIAFALLSTSALAAGGYKITPIVSDQPGVAPVQDPDLINPWGLAQGGDSQPVWTSDNGTNKSTFYDRNTGVKQSPVVAVPGAPTGIVAPPSGVNFNVTKNSTSGRCAFVFDTETGIISCWAPSLDTFNAITGFDDSAHHAAFKGLAVDATNKHLLAADFKNNKIDIIDTSWNLVGSFTDSGLPKSFAPFNVAVLSGKAYVAFAKRAKGSIDELHGAGLGYVDVFDLSGNLQTRLVSNGALNAPWGLAIAPSNFGTFSNALLVGNFGDGKINAYNPTTGDALGTLGNKKGKALKIDGLWALDPGPGNGQVQFSAGPNDETHGLIGKITPN
ncbi:MAG: TIGR03118 family protein [Alphaproteobacteria bacterium]|nr:TIGR03118 family protein [Alphaproteobacteria bacterium]